MSKTEIICIIDKSGSMGHLVDDTVGGFNSFINRQKEEDGLAYVTTVLFNDAIHTLHSGLDIREVSPMTKADYFPSGCTALLDTVGKTIDTVQNRIDEMESAKRPDRVLCVIITDGQENASRTYSKDKVKKMIQHQEASHNWKFLFLGANMDAVAEAGSLGIQATSSVNYAASSIGTQAVYDSINCAATSYRAVGSVDACWADAITDCDVSAKVSNCDEVSCNQVLADARAYTDSISIKVEG